MTESRGLWVKFLSSCNAIKEIGSFFTSQYAVSLANSPELAAEGYRIRHKVYCDELNYEAANEMRQERDDYDARASQLVLRYKPLNVHIGCVRLVQGDPTGDFLPFEKMCAETLDQKKMREIKASGHRYVEISRLAVDKQFRHMGLRLGVKSSMRSSFALISLILGIQAWAHITDTKYFFAIVEERLLNKFVKINLPVYRLGDGVEHRGMRYPIMFDRDEALQHMLMLMKPNFHRIMRELRAQTGFGRQKKGMLGVAGALAGALGFVFSNLPLVPQKQVALVRKAKRLPH